MDKIIKKERKLIQIIDNYFNEKVYFVDTRLNKSKYDYKLRKLIYYNTYKEWLLNEFENKLCIEYEYLYLYTNYCYQEKKILYCNHISCSNDKKNIFPDIDILKGELENEKIPTTNLSKLKFIYKNLGIKDSEHFENGYGLLNLNSVFYLVVKKNNKITEYIDLDEIEDLDHPFIIKTNNPEDCIIL